MLGMEQTARSPLSPCARAVAQFVSRFSGGELLNKKYGALLDAVHSLSPRESLLSSLQFAGLLLTASLVID
jgi:hypothetical protein